MPTNEDFISQKVNKILETRLDGDKVSIQIILNIIIKKNYIGNSGSFE